MLSSRSSLNPLRFRLPFIFHRIELNRDVIVDNPPAEWTRPSTDLRPVVPALQKSSIKRVRADVFRGRPLTFGSPWPTLLHADLSCCSSCCQSSPSPKVSREISFHSIQSRRWYDLLKWNQPRRSLLTHDDIGIDQIWMELDFEWVQFDLIDLWPMIKLGSNMAPAEPHRRESWLFVIWDSSTGSPGLHNCRSIG